MIKNVFARYLVLLTVGGSLLGGAALGLAGMANAATTTNACDRPRLLLLPERQGQAGADAEAGLAQPPRRLAHQRPERQLIAQHEKALPEIGEGLFCAIAIGRSDSRSQSPPAGAAPPRPDRRRARSACPARTPGRRADRGDRSRAGSP